MDAIVNFWNTVVSIAKSFTFSDALDVLLVTFIIYSAIKLVRETRAEQLIKGIIILVAVWGISYLLKLHMISTLLTYFFQFSLIALLIVFQPEIRRALEQRRKKVGVPPISARGRGYHSGPPALYQCSGRCGCLFSKEQDRRPDGF